MNFLKPIFYMSFLTLVLASCVGGETHPESLSIDYASNAPFIVEQIIKPENLTKSINFIEKDGLKDTFIVNLKTCLKDSFKKDNSIQGASFVIEYEKNLYEKNLYEKNLNGKNLNGKKRETVKVSVTSDVNGCIRWEEEYKYRYVIQGKWIVLKRTIKKEEGAYSGQEEISLAVNPWLEADDKEFPEILDLRGGYSKNYPVFKKHSYELNGLEYLSKNEVSKYPQLWAPEVKLQIEIELPDKEDKEDNKNIKNLLSKYSTVCSSKNQENCYKHHLNMSLTIPLKLRTYSLQKELIDKDVKGGSYNVKLQLLVIPYKNKKAYRVHEDVCQKLIHISDKNNSRTKYINLSCDIPISYFSQHANYKLAVEIAPEGSPKGSPKGSHFKKLPFTKFQGVYTIDLAKELKTGSVFTYPVDNDLDDYYKRIPIPSDVSIIGDMKIEYIYDAIKPSEAETETLKQEDYSTFAEKKLSDLGFHSVYLDVELKKVTFSNVENNENCSNNESVVKRRVRFIGKACIQDALTEYKKKGIEFRVFIEDENKKTIVEVFSDFSKKTIPKADAEGCISWPDSIEHKNFDRQVYLPRKIHFLSEDLNLYGVTSVAINPWQRAFQSYQDISQLSRDEIRTDSIGVDKPKMIINQFKSINLFPSYVLDRFLNIHLFHSLYFLFTPLITRHDNIALGRINKATEKLRDGYYILRVLLFRNPQETGDVNRVLSPTDIDTIRKTVLFDKNDKQVGGGSGRYITHIDTIINVSANFANVYIPLYFNKEQFFYLASRNLLSIQVIPVDPSGFKFKELNKERTTCELDLEKTKWNPFFEHDLITEPSVGVFQVQNWTNWNILQPIGDFDTDKIIDADSEGKKYRHFSLTTSNLKVKSSEAPILNGVFCKEDEDAESKSCSKSSVPGFIHQSNKNNSGIKEYYEKRFHKSILEANKNIKTEITSEDLVKEFAATNSLTVIDLYKEEGVNFVDDLRNSYAAIGKLKPKTQKKNSFSGFSDEITEEITEEFKFRIDEECNSGFRLYKKAIKCVNRVMEDYIIELLEELDANKNSSIFQDYLTIEGRRSDIEKILKVVIAKDQITNKISDNLINNVSKALEQIIDEGITEVNRSSLEVLTFAKSLCGFWFDSFYEKYLTTEQLTTSYTDYIKKFDYYRVLENDNLNDTSKGDFIISFMNMISNGNNLGDKKLEECHVNYGKCILVDHCKLRGHANLSKGYCERASDLKDESCLKVVEKECQKDGSVSVCKQKITETNCHSFLNKFCKINSNYVICQSYESRCLTNYHECIDTDIISEGFKESIEKENINMLTQTSKKIVSKKLDESNSLFYLEKMRKTPLLKTCLENPFNFFQFEFKMFIEELSKTPAKYSGGFAGNMGIGGSFSTGSYMNWTASRGSSLGLKHGMDLGFSAKKGVKGVNISLGIKALDISLSKNISSNISNSGRRAIDVRVAEGAFLVVSRATFDIDVTKFKKCVVIKPRPNAFFSYFKDGVWKSYDESIWNQSFRDHPYKKILVSRPGMMICNPTIKLSEDNPEKIDESYYYISQSMVDPSNSQFLNLYDLANRPFMAILRGRQEFLKYFKGLKIIMEGKRGDLENNSQINNVPSNMFVNYPHPADEALSFSLARREMGETGFHSGVYTYAYSQEDLNQSFVKNEGWLSQLFNKYESMNYFLPFPATPNNQIPVVIKQD